MIENTDGPERREPIKEVLSCNQVRESRTTPAGSVLSVQGPPFGAVPAF